MRTMPGKEPLRDKAMLQRMFLYDNKATSLSEEMLMKTRVEGIEGVKDLNELVRAARLSDEKREYEKRDRLCDEGLKAMTMLLASGNQLHDTTLAFGITASVYDRMAELHEIKGEKEMAKVYRSQAKEMLSRLVEHNHAPGSSPTGRHPGTESGVTKVLLEKKIKRD